MNLNYFAKWFKQLVFPFMGFNKQTQKIIDNKGSIKTTLLGKIMKFTNIKDEIMYIKIDLNKFLKVKNNRSYMDISGATGSYIMFLLGLLFTEHYEQKYFKLKKLTFNEKEKEDGKYGEFINLLSNILNPIIGEDIRDFTKEEKIKLLEEDLYFIDFDMIEFSMKYKPHNQSYMRMVEYTGKHNFFTEYNIIPVLKDFIVFDDLNLRTEKVIYSYNEICSTTLRELETSIFNRYTHVINPICFNKKNGNKIISIEDIKSVYSVLENSTFIGSMDKKILAEHKLYDEAYFFNPNMAKMLHGNLVSVETIFNMLGEDQNKVKENLYLIQQEKKKLFMIGLGGAMSNFVYWTERLADYFNIKEPIFAHVYCMDHDKLEISNLFRIPLDYITPIFLRNTEQGSNIILNKVLMFYNTKKFTKEYVLEPNYFSLNTRDIEQIDKNYDFIIGSPDLKTRNLLYHGSKKFICPLHSENELYIWENPKLENFEHMVESYGTINLSWFFLNMFKMTIELLGIIANKEQLEDDFLNLNYSAENINIEDNLVNCKSKETIILY